MKKWSVINDKNDGTFKYALLNFGACEQAIIADVEGKRMVTFRSNIIGVGEVSFQLTNEGLEQNMIDAEAKLKVHFGGLSKLYNELYEKLQ